MRTSRIIPLVVPAAVIMLLVVAWLGRQRKPSAMLYFQPLGRTTNASGTPEQAFAISNYTASTVEFLLGRYKLSAGPDGQILSNLESQMYFRLAPQFGTQAALTLPRDGTPWHASLNYRRVVLQPELGAKAIGVEVGLVRPNQVFPKWQATTSKEFDK